LGLFDENLKKDRYPILANYVTVIRKKQP
jgi:hypothetical protein